MTEALSGPLEARVGRKGVAAAADGSGAATAHEAATTWGETATPVGTVPRMPVTTTDSVTGITTSDFRAEVRKAAAAAVIVGGSTAAAWAAGATPTESGKLPS
jgi:hypothetical protein